MTGFNCIVLIAFIILIPVSGFASADCSVPTDQSDGGTLIASITGPIGWVNIWGVAYHDVHNMLYVGGCPNNEVAYGTYSGGKTVSWTVFDTVESICGFGCYEDNLLFAITQHDPMNPGPFYLHTWTLILREYLSFQQKCFSWAPLLPDPWADVNAMEIICGYWIRISL